MNTPVQYLLPVENRTWDHLMWILMFLRGAAYQIISHDELPDATGLIVTTEPPISEEHRERLGLKPYEKSPMRRPDLAVFGPASSGASL
jgi:hypothetical protein